MGRFTEMQWVRFVAGFPEKIIPPAQLSSNFFQVSGYGAVRAYKDWRDNSGNKYLAAGTDYALLVYSKTADSYSDVTPIRPSLQSNGTLSSALTTTQGSGIITVATSLPVQVGDSVFLSNGTVISGISLSGFYTVASIVAGTSFTISQTTLATSGVVSGGGTLTYGFPRGSLTNQIFTTTGSTTVVIALAAPVSIGDWVFLNNGTAVDGITLNGWYIVTGINAGVSFNVTAPIAASGTTAGGGGTLIYMIPRVTLSSNPFSVTSGSATVTITHTKHGASVGDIVYWTGGATVGGIALTTGTYKIASVIGVNSYTITAPGVANATTTGGGTPTFQYGITFHSLTNTSFPAMWTLSPYGQQLLSCPSGAGIFVYDPSRGGRAYPLLNAPVGVLAMFVTAERFVMALGQTGAKMTVAWPDQSDYTNWTPTPTNTANSGRALQEGSTLIGGMVVRDGISMIFSDTAAYIFTYSGDNFIYNSTVSGRNCGCVGPQAMVPMNNLGYWFSGKEWYAWNGSVSPLMSDDIRDYVVKDLDTTNAYKCCLGTWIAYQEVWTMYPSVTDALTENTQYVINHTNQGSIWSRGYTDNNVAEGTGAPTQAFSAWLDSSLFMYPIISWWAPVSLRFSVEIFNQNINNSNTGGDFSSLTFSPIDISKGGNNMDVFSFIPDFQLFNDFSQQIKLTINTQDYPADSIITNGPYILGASQFAPNKRIDLRLGTKLLGYTIADSESASGSLWRLGVPRIEIQPAGARR